MNQMKKINKTSKMKWQSIENKKKTKQKEKVIIRKTKILVAKKTPYSADFAWWSHRNQPWFLNG